MRHTSISEIFSSPITILVGHAGTGKTNAALGLALALADEGFEVTLADLDVVNPYFRSSDYPELLAGAGVHLIAPSLARTTLDTPSLTGELDVAIEQVAADPGKRLVIDVGGDDDGATTIGRWATRLTGADAQLLYVVSAYRSFTTEPEAAAGMLADIEDHAHLRAHAVLNTSNLGDETSVEHVAHGRSFAQEVARRLDLPLAATVVPVVAVVDALPSTTDTQRASIAPASVSDALQETHTGTEPLVLMPRFVRTPWDD